MSSCQIDDRKVGDGARLCRRCTSDLERDLDAVPDIVADLLITVSRQDHVQAAQAGRAPGTPLAFNVDASRELTDLAAALNYWTRRYAVALGVTAPPDTNPTACAGWLLRLRRVIRHHDSAGRFSTDVHAAIRAARHATDLAPVSSRFPVGPCPQIVDAQFCDGTVLATITTTADEPPTMTCLRCQCVWPAEQWLRAGKRIKRRRDETGWRPPRRVLAEASG